MSKCLTCKYAMPDGLCLAKGKFTVLDADACETYAPIMEHELATLRRKNAELRELAGELMRMADSELVALDDEEFRRIVHSADDLGVVW